MNDDYLWDRSGAPDPAVARLEELLAPYRAGAHTGTGATGGAPPLSGRGRRTARTFARIAMVAALLLAIGGAWLFFDLTRGAWEISDAEGSVRVAGAAVTTGGMLGIGEWLETGETGRARIRLPIGSVSVRPGSRVRLVRADLTEQRMQLAHGSLYVNVIAPPKIFFVETPSAVAVDMGCAYTLDVDVRGAGTLEVMLGFVSFERGGRSSMVPREAICHTTPGTGPGTPFFGDASPALREGLARLDAGVGHERALVVVLAEARTRDTLTLWHLLARVEPADRGLVYERMAMHVPPPAGVTRDGILRLDPGMLERWWERLERAWY